MEDVIEVVDYDPAWPGRFAREREALLARLPGLGADVEHIGSTAVPGLAAKPTIDLMAGVAELRMENGLVEAIAGLGYRYLGEYGIPGRHFFRKGAPPTHHVHWVRRDADFWQKQIVFRDYLRGHPQELAGYVAVKRDLAARFHHDRASYTAGKTACIENLLEKAWRWRKAPLIVIDLEATCWEAGQDPARQEIIEIGAVKLGPDLGPLSEFTRFVRPAAEPRLSDFCRNLTSIRQEDVDAAPDFPTAFADFAAWAGAAPLRLASWSAYDLEQFRSDCRRHDMTFPASLESFLDLRRLFAVRRGVEPCPMTRALELLGMPLEGTLHRGIDDARNAARLAHVLLGPDAAK